MLLLLLAAVAVVGLPVSVNAFAYYTSRAARQPPGRTPRADLVRAFVQESVAAVCCLAAWPFAPLLARLRSSGPPRRGTAVFIAGCAPDRASLWLLASRLRRHGWLASYPAPRPWPRRRDAARAAIDACVRLAHATAADQPVVLIGHAAGGLAARDYLRSNPEAPVSMLLTVGTPHRETAKPPVRFACLHGPGADITDALADGDFVPDRFDVVAISGDFDAWVVPADAAYYPRAFNVSVALVGHFGLLVSRKVFGLILENIDCAALPQTVRPASTATSTRATSSPSL